MAINESKKIYIAKIRSESAYPTFRSLILIFSGIFLCLGILSLIAGILSIIYLKENQYISMFIGIINGLILIVLSKLFKETCSMLADIADSITEINSRTVEINGSNPKHFVASSGTPTDPNDAPQSSNSESAASSLSQEELEKKATELLHVAKDHLSNGAKEFAINVLREIVRKYPSTRAADKARSSLKGR